MPKARVKIAEGTFSGQVLLDGQRAYFKLNVKGPRVDAEFQPHPESEKPLDQWQLFRALETFIDENLRG